MSITKRIPLRAWMFIYVGMLAAVVLAAPPADQTTRTAPAQPVLPAAAEAPLLRRDI